MSRQRILLLAGAGLIAGVLALRDASARDWSRAESGHFIVFSDVGQNKTRDYVRQLESFKFLSEMMLDSDAKASATQTKLTIYLFDNLDLMKIVKPNITRNYIGVYMHCAEGAQAFAWRPDSYDPSEVDASLMVVLHEYTHHIMYSRLRQFYPMWYVEGFADYMSTINLSQGSFLVGQAIQGRLASLRDDSTWLDFRTLIDPVQFRAEVKKHRVNTQIFYAQSWLLTHYMLADSDRTKAFNNYFERIGRGADAISSFESATGISVANLKPLLVAYRAHLHGLKATIPNMPIVEVAIVYLAPAESEYVLQAAALSTCPKEDYGKSIATSLRSMRPRHEHELAFRLALDRAEILFGDPAAAIVDLESIVATPAGDFEAHYLLGRALYAAAKTDRASGEFLAAYRLNKTSAPNLYYLSRSLDDGAISPSKAVLNAASAAAVYAPDIVEFAMNAATINIRSGNPEQAIRFLQPFASDPHEPERALRVVAMIAAIQDGKDLAEVMSSYARAPEQSP